MRVHLWDTGGSDAVFRHCNCESMSLHATQGYPSQRLEVARMALAPGWQWFNASLPATLSPPSYPASPVVQYPPTQPAIPSIAVPSVQTIQATQVVDLISRMNAMNVNGVNGPMLNPQDPNHVQYAAKLIQQSQLAQQQQQQQMYAQAMQSQAGAPRPSAYTVPPSGLPVNTANGSIRTEARGVFISGLSYKAKSKDIEAAFSRAGEISSCEVQKDSTTGKSKGKATVRYTPLNFCLLFIPVSWALHYTHQSATLIFVFSCMGIIPLAALLGFGTEQVAHRTSSTVGGLLNATLGNVVEMIIAGIALSEVC